MAMRASLSVMDTTLTVNDGTVGRWLFLKPKAVAKVEISLSYIICSQIFREGTMTHGNFPDRVASKATGLV